MEVLSTQQFLLQNQFTIIMPVIIPTCTPSSILYQENRGDTFHSTFNAGVLDGFHQIKSESLSSNTMTKTIGEKVFLVF